MPTTQTWFQRHSLNHMLFGCISSLVLAFILYKLSGTVSGTGGWIILKFMLMFAAFMFMGFGGFGTLVTLVYRVGMLVKRRLDPKVHNVIKICMGIFWVLAVIVLGLFRTVLPVPRIAMMTYIIAMSVIFLLTIIAMSFIEGMNSNFPTKQEVEELKRRLERQEGGDE